MVKGKLKDKERIIFVVINLTIDDRRRFAGFWDCPNSILGRIINNPASSFRIDAAIFGVVH